jgi:hypothetical protein
MKKTECLDIPEAVLIVQFSFQQGDHFKKAFFLTGSAGKQSLRFHDNLYFHYVIWVALSKSLFGNKHLGQENQYAIEALKQTNLDSFNHKQAHKNWSHHRLRSPSP